MGVAVGNPEALSSLYTLKTHADSGQFLPIMEAGVEALTGDQGWTSDRNAVYSRRRDLVAEALGELKVEFSLPKGALYIWFRCPSGWISAAFTRSLLETIGVSMAPGVMFGQRGEGFVRLTLCAPEARLEEAMGRLDDCWDQVISGEWKREGDG